MVGWCLSSVTECIAAARLPPAHAGSSWGVSVREEDIQRETAASNWLWPLKGHQSDTILTVWLHVFPSPSLNALCQPAHIFMFAVLHACMSVWVYVCAGCYNLELWRRGRGKDRDVEEIDETRKKEGYIEEKKKGGGPRGADRCWEESDSERADWGQRERERVRGGGGGGKDSLLEEE